MDDLCWESNRGTATLLPLLDFSWAFDTIDHGILLDTLQEMGLRGTVLQWLWSYRQDRFQKVALDECSLAPWLCGATGHYLVSGAI